MKTTQVQAWTADPKSKNGPADPKISVRPHRISSFEQIPFTKWPETWRCTCGGITSEYVCPNCGQTPHDIKRAKKRARQREILAVLEELVAEL